MDCRYRKRDDGNSNQESLAAVGSGCVALGVEVSQNGVLRRAIAYWPIIVHDWDV